MAPMQETHRLCPAKYLPIFPVFHLLLDTDHLLVLGSTVK
jgi:hypothetical protein